MFNLLYLAHSQYGGWVSFTSHLALKHNLPLYKAHTKTEQRKDNTPVLRKYGYGVNYQNISGEAISKMSSIIITAISKNYYDYLQYIPDNSFIVIHDPTELHGKVAKPLFDHIRRFRIITIRKSVQAFIKEKYNLDSTFIIHPFHAYPITKESDLTRNVCISRIDYDKHIDIILKANKLLDPAKAVWLHGADNKLYSYRCLDSLNYKQYFKKPFKKDFNNLDTILKDTKYVVDMSAIKNDGGGTQYTFLEAIHHKCMLVLSKKWITPDSIFINGFNCLVAENENDIVNIINENNINTVDNAMDILNIHTAVDWVAQLSKLSEV
jgi:hypothetical protein